MILQRFYSNPKRIDIPFHNGLNIIYADKERKSTDKDTRHGAGKTTLIKLIDFCLLGEIDEKITTSKEFQKFEFTLELRDENHHYKIRRSIKNKEIVSVAIDSDDFKEMEIENAKHFFSQILFGFKEDKENKTVSFRTLMNFIKREEEIGFLKVFYYYPSWQAYIMNAVNLFLLGLNYKLPLEKQDLVKNKETVRKIIFGLEQSLKRKNVPNKSTLKAEKRTLELQTAKRDELLKNFKIYEEYHELEEESNDLTKEIKISQNLLFIQNQQLEEYRLALSEKINLNIDELKEFYNSLKLNIPEGLQKKYIQILDFHKKLIENRNTYLSDEIKRIEANIGKLRKKIEDLDIKRAEIMKLLETYGALSEYNLILKRFEEGKQRILDISNLIQVYEEIKDYQNQVEKIKGEINESNQLSEKMINDNEQSINEITQIFNGIFKSIANVPVFLIIGTKDKYKVDDQLFIFEIKGERKDSPGVNKMKIVAYDLAILLFNQKINRSFTKFIFHDGILSSLDDRQRKNILQKIIMLSDDENFQYITTMNSNDYIEELNLDKYEIKKVTDSEEGSLMGFKF